MKNTLLVLLVIALLILLLSLPVLAVFSPALNPKPREYTRLCYNSNNFKTDYCSKLGKTWRI